MITSRIEAFQSHQPLPVGSCQFLQHRRKCRTDCRHSQAEPSKPVLLVRVLNPVKPRLGDGFHFQLAVHLLRVIGDYNLKTSILSLAVKVKILGTAPPGQIDYMLDIVRAAQQCLD